MNSRRVPQCNLDTSALTLISRFCEEMSKNSPIVHVSGNTYGNMIVEQQLGKDRKRIETSEGIVSRQGSSKGRMSELRAREGNRTKSDPELTAEAGEVTKKVEGPCYLIPRFAPSIRIVVRTTAVLRFLPLKVYRFSKDRSREAPCHESIC